MALKKLTFFIFLSLVFSSILKADTLTVTSHNRVQMVWHENYDRIAYFPTEGKTYRKIFMYYTLGCANGGCSDWDYDVNTYIMHNTGLKDSSISRLDTISTSPLVVDTVWNVFDAVVPFELGRFITPYGTYMDFRSPSYGTAGFDSSWQHTFMYDVTDYALLLKDSVRIRSQYNGWSSGFSATIRFVFIEGTPQRNVLDVQMLYTKGGGYQNTQQFESQICPAKTLQLPAHTKQAQAKVIITGHGANTGTGCGEFCDLNYYLKVNGTQRFQSRMWREDCGDVAVSPQGGTWIFSRGNWCPGDKVHERRHELTPYLTGSELELDLDIEPYSLSGSGGSSHSLSTTVFFYGPDNFNFDAELNTILAPSSATEHLKWNPSCGNPIVVIKNNAKTPLTYTKIEYGPKGGLMSVYEWKGNLEFEELDTVYLPAPRWTGIDTAQTRFTARLITPNHRYSDEQPDNDAYEVACELVPRLEPFKLLFRTNGVPQENNLSIINEKGELVYEKKSSEMQANTLYSVDLNLPAGCYQLLLTDEGGDGLDFWYYALTNPPYTAGRGGFLRILKQTGGTYENFGGDFGQEIRYSFIVGEMSIPEAQVLEENEVKIFPNPSNGTLFISLPEVDDEVIVSLIDGLGQEVLKQEHIPTGRAYWYQMDISFVPRGVYTVQTKIGDSITTEKIIVTK